MEQDKIFIWLAEEMLKGEFIDWVVEQGEGGISYSMLGRAQERQKEGRKLTLRQEKAERLAKLFKVKVLEKRANAGQGKILQHHAAAA